VSEPVSQPVSTVTALSTPWSVLVAAIVERRPLHISYHGKERIVSPHALGWKADRPLLLAYQAAAGTPSGTGWRNFFVDEIDLVALADAAERWRSGTSYNPAHPFSSIDEVAFSVGRTAVR
jgi:predicted DNA-binding transcriptional regulator YafY